VVSDEKYPIFPDVTLVTRDTTPPGQSHDDMYSVCLQDSSKEVSNRSICQCLPMFANANGNTVGKRESVESEKEILGVSLVILLGVVTYVTTSTYCLQMEGSFMTVSYHDFTLFIVGV
jgi:hypothetical protein